MSVNAHSSAQNQAAAQTFVDFIARPKQNALFAQTDGRLDPVRVPEGADPGLHVRASRRCSRSTSTSINPTQSWWNANVLLALQQNEIGLITGQRSIDDVLNAMDAAWKQGPVVEP